MASLQDSNEFHSRRKERADTDRIDDLMAGPVVRRPLGHNPLATSKSAGGLLAVVLHVLTHIWRIVQKILITRLECDSAREA